MRQSVVKKAFLHKMDKLEGPNTKLGYLIQHTYTADKKAEDYYDLAN